MKILGTTIRAPFSSRRVRELDPFEAYQLWAATYDDVENNALLFAEQTVIVPLLEELPLRNSHVLDAGCGTGRYLQVITKFKPRLLTGIDFSPNMITKAQSSVDDGVHLQIACMNQLPFKDRTFDAVISTLALDHLEDLSEAFAELARVLRDGGTMILSCFHPFGQLLGWQRTFQASNGRAKADVAVKYYGHQHADYLNASRNAGLVATTIIEPTVDERLEPYYRRSGRLDLYERYRGYPLLLIMELQKQ